MPTDPIPVRLNHALIARLRKAADRMGTNKAALIRFCAQTFIEHFERHGGVASLPLDWKEILAAQDGRTSASLAEDPQAANLQTGINIGSGSVQQSQKTDYIAFKKPRAKRKKG